MGIQMTGILGVKKSINEITIFVRTVEKKVALTAPPNYMLTT